MKKRILVIEDNEQNLYLIRFLLESADYEVYSAMDSYEGVLMAKSLIPDIILLDIQLPSLDGYGVAKLIRSHDLTEKIPIIAVTSYAMPGDREKAMEAGCNGYIEKPIDPETFIETMESYFTLEKNITNPEDVK